LELLSEESSLLPSTLLEQIMPTVNHFAQEALHSHQQDQPDISNYNQFSFGR